MYSKYGLDLSHHNGVVDFEEVKKNHDFVILRNGFYETADNMFLENYSKAKKVGLKVGTYLYSYALTVKEVKAECERMYDRIKGLEFEYPIVIDMEDADNYKVRNGFPTDKTLCAICEYFCEFFESRGYYVMIYASLSWFNTHLKNVSPKYDKWIADWGTNNGKNQRTNYSSKYHLHQFTSRYLLNGKYYDRNVCYLDFASLIKNKGLNGFSKKDPEKPEANIGLKVGDIVRISNDATRYVTGQKIPAWVKNRVHTIKQFSADKSKVLLKEINSWVYVSNIDKL